jgi:hypothetical protein
MKPTIKTILYGYGGFAILNYSIAWLTSSARTGRVPGQNALLDFNDSLMRLNVLGWALPIPIASSSSAPVTTVSPMGQPITVTQAPAGGAAQGTTTFFGGTDTFNPGTLSAGGGPLPVPLTQY